MPQFATSEDADYREMPGGDAYEEDFEFESDSDEVDFAAIALRRDSPPREREPESQEGVEEFERNSQDSAQYSEGTMEFLSQYYVEAVYGVLDEFPLEAYTEEDMQERVAAFSSHMQKQG